MANYYYSITIENEILSNYVKYDVLDNLIHTHYQNSKANNLNIYIDIMSMLTDIILDERLIYTIDDKAVFASTIINMCMHYKRFFLRKNVQCEFFLIFGTNTPAINNSLVYKYNAKFKYLYSISRFKRYIEMNMKLLEYIVQFIPSIYYFDAKDNETSAFIKYVMEYFGTPEDYENLIISKDILSFQLVSDTCKVLRPKKYKGVDSSYIVDIYNIWNVLINNIRHIRSEEIVSSGINLHPRLFTNVLAMSGVPERHIVSLTSTSHVLKSLLNNSININSVGYNQSSLNKILDIINKGVLENLGNDVEDRWKSINADFQCETIRNNPIYSQLVLKDYDDTAALMRLVSKYFDKLPLHLS
nr:MAG TPA: hypothetical protein [Caudoviricetes sp.]